MVGNERLNINKPIIMMSNLSIDHPLSNFELLELQKLLISDIQLSQIYFKDDVDIDTIEKIKLLLENFPNVNDKEIEKNIMKNISDSEKEKLINMNFANIDSWNVSYFKEEDKYFITSLSKYRMMEEWFNKILYDVNNNDLSQLDKVCFLYDKVKMLEFDNNTKYDRIPEIISDNRASTYGYNLIFKELLAKIGIPSIIGKISNKDENNYINFASINDKNYSIDGIYGFDPSMDTISKNQYKNSLARKMNYNFFGLTIEKIKKIYEKNRMDDFLKVISSDDIDEFKYLNNLHNIKYNNEESHKIENTFNISFIDMYRKTTNTVEIPYCILMNIITKSVENYPNEIIDKELFAKVITDNYSERNAELFTNKYVKKMYKIDN